MSLRTSKRVLLYTLHCGNMYGTERMALATLKGFGDCHRVVMAPSAVASPALLDAAAGEGYECHRVESRSDLLLALAKLFLRHRTVDVISTSAMHNLVCAWVAAVFRVRLRQLNVVHGGGEERYSYANKRVLNRTRVRLIAVSAFVRSRLVAHGVQPARVTVVENFMSQEGLAHRRRRPPFNPLATDARAIDPNAVRVVVVSRIDPFKRLDVLLSAISSGRLSMCRFDVYGDGELLEDYRRQARAAGLPINFHGHVDRIADRLVESDFLVHTCPEEPFGLVVLEAFSASLPVIVPDSGGIAEVVEHSASGFRYESLNASSLCESLLTALAIEGPELDRITTEATFRLHSRFSELRGVAEYRVALRTA